MQTSQVTRCVMASPATPALNSWEARALNYHFPDPSLPTNNTSTPRNAPQWRQTQDPVIYPGLYSSSGFDILNILFQVISRPNPIIQLGPVDSSVALILCDLELADNPIVYVSDSFCELTGYARSEVLGRNCRFLQTPPPSSPGQPRNQAAADRVAIHRLSQAVKGRQEIQLQLVNYKKNGKPFTNILSIIPIQLSSTGYRYAVGFQVEID